MDRPKVLHLIDSNGMYGAESVVLTLLDNLRNSPYHCILGCIRESEDEYVELGKRAKNIGIHAIYFTMNRGLNFSGIVNIYSFIKKHDIKIVHSHGYKTNIFLGLIRPFLSMVQVTTTIHGWAKEFAGRKLVVYEKINCFFIKRFFKCVAVSNAVQNDMVKRGIPSRKIIIIHNGIKLKKNNELADKNKIKMAFNIPRDVFLIGTAGRLVKEKGVDVFIEGAAHFLRYNSNALFLIAGDGPLLSELEKQVGQLGIDHKVLFLGFVDRIYDYLSALDIFVLSSRTEGLPMILLEAMNAGCAIVCSKVGGVIEVIQDKKDAILIEPDNPVALSDSLSLFYNNGLFRNEVAIKAKKKVRELFSSQKMAAEYISLYDTALKLRKNSKQSPFLRFR